MNKRAYLVTSVLENDAKSSAENLLAKLDKTNMAGRFALLNEDLIVYDYVEQNGMHPLCRTEWLKPIRNNVIVSLLHKTEKYFNDLTVNGIIISGQFILDQEVKDAYIEILNGQGYDVTVMPIYSSWLRIMMTGFDTNQDLKRLYSLWKKFCQQYGRIYHPDTSQPKAIVIDSKIVSDSNNTEYDSIIEMINNYKNSGYVIICFDGMGLNPSCVAVDSLFAYCDSKEKIDIFWSNLAYHYNVKLVIEKSMLDAFVWEQANIPCINFAGQV